MPTPTPRPFPLAFSPQVAAPKPGKHLCEGLSAVLQVGDTLWLANDESATIERLALRGDGDGDGAGDHRQFDLADFVDLPVPRHKDDTPEVDIEGMDAADGFLWITGSHSRKRCKPQADQPHKTQRALAEVSRDANRYLLARIPLVAGEDGLPTLARTHGRGKARRTAGSLKAGPRGNTLTRALAKDAHLAGFLRLPGKENGFDIEGLAVRGERVWLGLRGPVLAGWAVLLEVRLRAGGRDGLRLGRLPDGARVRKHLLDLGGLGVRDLCLEGDDLLLLAGPTMQLDGPVRLLRWAGAATHDAPCVVGRADLQVVLEVPNGQDCDHAEGMALLRPGTAGTGAGLLLVHDKAPAARRPGPDCLLADLYPWPLA